jgi:exopolysaccharide production protein ExoY
MRPRLLSSDGTPARSNTSEIDYSGSRSQQFKRTARNPSFVWPFRLRAREGAIDAGSKNAFDEVETVACETDALGRPVGGERKRLIDIMFAGFWLTFFLPLFGVIALLIKFSDGGPVFYRHWRVGHARRPFECLKFRTMVMDADEVLHLHLAQSTAAQSEWNASRKLKKDPRVTAVGWLLRKLSLDELPQLINILRGEMSIVGPRPIVSDEVQMYGQHAEFYFRARPGLTGLWQISGRNDRSYDERVALDCAYVTSWSLRTDFVIIARSVPVVLSSRGSY